MSVSNSINLTVAIFDHKLFISTSVQSWRKTHLSIFFKCGLIFTQSRMLPKYSANATRLQNGIIRCQKTNAAERKKENSWHTSATSFFHSAVEISIVKRYLLEQFSGYSERGLTWWDTTLGLKKNRFLEGFCLFNELNSSGALLHFSQSYLLCHKDQCHVPHANCIQSHSKAITILV